MARKLPDTDECNDRNEPATTTKDKYIRNTLGHPFGLNPLHQRENAFRKGLYFGWDAPPGHCAAAKSPDGSCALAIGVSTVPSPGLNTPLLSDSQPIEEPQVFI
jgi:hypothetical protein